MKGSSDRTKVVLRHLPPTITQAQLLEQIDGAFAGRYNWCSFRPGKNHPKHPSYSRAYIDFKGSDDVIEFAEFFDGHLFVNEKGSQYKAIVEYAPSQRVPKQSLKKDGRIGTISKDAEYKEFLEYVTKPVQNLPSAEIQLERREAERTGAPKESPIVTPLMNFIRQKRAASESLRTLSSVKLSREFGGLFVGNSEHGFEKRRVPTKMRYVSRDSAKNTNGKGNSTSILVTKRNDQEYSGNPVNSTATSRTAARAGNSGMSLTTDSGNKKILLLKGKGKDISHASSGISQQQNVVSPIKNLSGALRQYQRREGSGRIIKNIHVNQDSHSSQASVVHTEQKVQSQKVEDRRPPRPSHSHFVSKGKNTNSEDRVVGNEMHGSFGERNEKYARNRVRPDRGVWALRRSGSHATDESMSLSASQPIHFSLESSEGTYSNMRHEVWNAKSGEFKIGSGRNGHFHQDNGSHKHVGRRLLAHGSKDIDGSLVVNEMKSKRGSPPVHGSNEKQIWVQKSAAGS